MFLLSIQHSAFSIIHLLAARHEDDPTKFIIFAIVLVLMWAIQAIGKLSKRKPQNPPKRELPGASTPPSRTAQQAPRSQPRPAAQATRLPPLSQVHRPNQPIRPQIATSSPQRLPNPDQQRVAELLFANKLITPAQANRMRVEMQRHQGSVAFQPQRAAVKPPPLEPPAKAAQPAPPPLPAIPAPPRAAAPATVAVPSRSLVAQWINMRTLRSQFILAEALQPPLALRKRSHLP